MAEKQIDFDLPPPPWTHANLGEEVYCRLARELGYFDPAGERSRPDLDPTPFLETIRAQHAAKKKTGGKE